MKIQKLIYAVLMLLPLPVTLVALAYLPDRIPAHYGADYQVDRWGSKYESLIFPILAILFGLLLLAIAKYSEKQGKGNERICILSGIFLLLIMDILTGYFLYTDFHQVENLADLPVNVDRLIFALLGLLLIVMGMILPKVKMNAVMGLRTKWSMKNETTWKKSQQFGGISFIIVGILILLLCLFTEGLACCFASIGVLLLSLPIDVYYTYRVAKKY